VVFCFVVGMMLMQGRMDAHYCSRMHTAVVGNLMLMFLTCFGFLVCHPQPWTRLLTSESEAKLGIYLSPYMIATMVTPVCRARKIRVARLLTRRFCCSHGAAAEPRRRRALGRAAASPSPRRAVPRHRRLPSGAGPAAAAAAERARGVLRG
jgi:hypothetical protein